MTEYLLKDVGGVLIVVTIVAAICMLLFPASMPSPKVGHTPYLRGRFAALFWASGLVVVLIVLLMGYIMYEVRHGIPAFASSDKAGQIRESICSKVPGCTSVGDPYLLYRPEFKSWVMAFDVEAVGSDIGLKEITEAEPGGKGVREAIQSLPFLVRMVIEDDGVLRVNTKKVSKKGRK